MDCAHAAHLPEKTKVTRKEPPFDVLQYRPNPFLMQHRRRSRLETAGRSAILSENRDVLSHLPCPSRLHPSKCEVPMSAVNITVSDRAGRRCASSGAKWE